MPRPRTSLRAFLATARDALAAAGAPQQQLRPAAPLTLVVGNESADLDSLCSAVLLAYLRSHSAAPGDSGALHVPLANLPRPDLALRPELAAVLRRADVRPADLPTLSELPATLAPAATRWLLVDHNAMTGDLGRRFGDRAVGCVDHHQDEGRLGAPAAGEPRVIRHCGSCASLVVLETAGQVWETETAETDQEATLWDAQVAHLALGPILIDTDNLTSADKTTDDDVRAVEAAEARIRRAGVAYDRDAFFREVAALKQDLSGLSYRDVLRKDYKEWTDDGGLVLGTSSVAQGLEYLLDRVGDADALLAGLRSWSRERHIDIAVVLTAFHSSGEEEFCRELLVSADGAEAVRAARAFADKYGQDLGLETWRDGQLDADGDDQWRMCWRQTMTKHSRKQVAPMLRDAMKQAAARQDERL